MVDLLFGLAKVTDKPVSKDELLNDDDLPEGYGEAEADEAGQGQGGEGKAEKPKRPEAKAAR